jgi:hypothetical protein
MLERKIRGGEAMFSQGAAAGFLLASLLWAAVLWVMRIEYEDELWNERLNGLIRNRLFQAFTEDHRGWRRTAECVQAMDELDGVPSLREKSGGKVRN